MAQLPAGYRTGSIVVTLSARKIDVIAIPCE